MIGWPTTWWAIFFCQLRGSELKAHAAISRIRFDCLRVCVHPAHLRELVAAVAFQADDGKLG